MRDHRVTCAPIARGARLALIAAAALAAGACSSSSGDGGGGSADAVSDVASDAGVGAGDAGSGPVDDLGRPADDAGTQADTGSPADAGGPQDAGGDGLAPSEDTAPSEDVMPSDDISGAADITPSDDSSAPEDVIAPEDVMPSDDIAPPEDVMPSDDIAPPEDVMPSDDIAPPEDGWQPEVEQPAIEPATLLLEDQVLDKPFDVVIVKVAQLPSTATQAGTLRLRIQGGDDDGLVAGTKLLAYGTLYEDLEIELVGPVVASQLFVADILDGAGEPFPGVDGTPLAVTFSVTGDSENPELVVDTQDVDPDDLYGLEISRVYVPERFPQGIWLAVYEDADGVPGALRGKQKFMPGLHEQTPFALTNKLIMGRQLHAIMRTPVPGSGSWTNTGAIIEDLSGQPMTAQFFADSLAFNPILEVEDQELVQADEVVIKKVVVPVEYIGGGWVAIYADDNGSPGELLGNKYFNKGTKEDQILDLDVALEGDNTLHAVLHAGQTWAVAKDIVMVAPGGGEMTLTFKVGAQDLSYIDAAPYTTDDPRHVVVKRAYSFHKPAWVVLARDEGGQPGTVIARKKILQKFAGNVHFTVQTNDFLTSGTAAEYLTGQPGTFRRCARGDDLLHVMLYEDDPQDGEFTYTPGGTEDLPVLDAEDNPVTELLEVTVAASIKNVQKDSERYYLPCPLSQHVGNPTSLPVDCRCHANIQTLDFPECKAVIADGLDMSFGAGPRVRTQNFGHFRSGFVETDTQELIALAVWKDYETVWPENQVTIDVAAVMAIDVETRERRIVGGRYKDPATGI